MPIELLQIPDDKDVVGLRIAQRLILNAAGKAVARHVKGHIEVARGIEKLEVLARLMPVPAGIERFTVIYSEQVFSRKAEFEFVDTEGGK